MATISQRITLEGGEQLKKQLEDLGKAGKQAFESIQTAGQKVQVDPQKFEDLAKATQVFGAEGTKAANAVTQSLNQTNEAAVKTGDSFLSTATKFKIAAAALVASITAVTAALTKGAAETGAKIADQAEKLKFTAAQWIE